MGSKEKIMFLNKFSKYRITSKSITNLFEKNISQAEKPKFLITGCGGQIGTTLIPTMRKRYGVENVISSDINIDKAPKNEGIYERLDVTDFNSYKDLVEKHNINYILHLSGILSATGEANPNLAKEFKTKIFIPSTIAVFGPEIDKKNIPNACVLDPTTIYGVTKVFMENMGNYYHFKHGVDFRSIRYPGVISPYEYESHGTTDYASEIYFNAMKGKEYHIPLAPKTVLPFVYLNDVIEGTLKFIEADKEKLTQRTYNMQGLSFNCDQCVEAVNKAFPGFKYKYKPDLRDEIALGWPDDLNDELARKDWGWNPLCKDLPSLTTTMVKNLKVNKPDNQSTTQEASQPTNQPTSQAARQFNMM